MDKDIKKLRELTEKLPKEGVIVEKEMMLYILDRILELEQRIDNNSVLTNVVSISNRLSYETLYGDGGINNERD